MLGLSILKLKVIIIKNKKKFGIILELFKII